MKPALPCCVAPAYVGPDLDLAATIPLLAEQGVEWVDTGTGGPDYFDPDNAQHVAAVRAALRQSGLRVNAHHSFFGPQVDVSSADPALLRTARQVHARHLQVAAKLGAAFYILHPAAEPPDQPGRERAMRVGRLCDSLAELAAVAGRSGIAIALENMLPPYAGDRGGDLVAALTAVRSDALGLCFDTGHAHIAGDAVAAARILLPYTITIHAQDNHGESDEHLFPGQGTVDWRGFVRAYDEAGCTAPWLFESLPPDGGTMRDGVEALQTLIRTCRKKGR